MATTSASKSSSLSARELRAWRGMLRAHAALTKALDADLEAQHGIPLTSYEVLLLLADAPDHRMRMSDLADAVLLSRSGLTRLVDRMARDGLLERETCDSDARGAYARITPAGLTLLAAARRTHLAGVRARFLDHVAADEQDLLGSCWERVLGDSAEDGVACG
ncbi:unannotated protein [freshwater metagenome]|uniref:Unannotated protein n=1 Tax=freshwater metagenome TaxID=449393 RepID=A0A6J7HSU0_9ZZZZ|nr:MarR family transcriptional regulator [Actinomycetota bacterium]